MFKKRKKILILMVMIVSIFVLTACNSKDALKFKKEYESLNNTIREKDGKKIRSINIDKNNPMIYKSAGDIINKINNKETFVVYFGFSDCPWCRSILPTLIDVSNNLNIKTIYYVDVKNIRDTLALDENNEVITQTKGSNDYYKLIKLLGNVLSNYTLTDDNGNKIDTGEKRIYAPNIVSVVDGLPTKATTGISERQADGYMKLTDEIINDTYKQIENVMKLVK